MIRVQSPSDRKSVPNENDLQTMYIDVEFKNTEFLHCLLTKNTRNLLENILKKKALPILIFKKVAKSILGKSYLCARKSISWEIITFSWFFFSRQHFGRKLLAISIKSRSLEMGRPSQSSGRLRKPIKITAPARVQIQDTRTQIRTTTTTTTPIPTSNGLSGSE